MDEKTEQRTETSKQKFSERFIKFHDKNYKLLLFIPVILFVFCFAYMFNFYQKNSDFIYRDISLTGGTSVTISEQIDIDDLRKAVSGKLESVDIREISDLVTREQIAVIVETKADKSQTQKVLEDYLGYPLVEGENSNFEFTGSVLGEDFYKQLLIAILIAFCLM